MMLQITQVPTVIGFLSIPYTSFLALLGADIGPIGPFGGKAESEVPAL